MYTQMSSYNIKGVLMFLNILVSDWIRQTYDTNYGNLLKYIMSMNIIHHNILHPTPEHSELIFSLKWVRRDKASLQLRKIYSFSLFTSCLIYLPIYLSIYLSIYQPVIPLKQWFPTWDLRPTGGQFNNNSGAIWKI